MKKNQAIVEHVIYEFFGKGDLSKYEQLVGKDVKVHYPSSSMEIFSPTLYGIQNVRAVDQEHANAFKINSIEIDDVMISQDKILVRWAFDATHKGDFFRFKASFREFDLTGQTMYQFNKEGKIGEVWQAWDMLGLVRKIGEGNVISIQERKLIKQASRLSEREKDCLKHLLLGKTAKETASVMQLSFRTVEYYFENIKDKLDCFSKRELCARARLLEKYHIL